MRCALYLITPSRVGVGFSDELARVLDAGDVAAVQLRLKGETQDRLRHVVDSLLPITQAREVPLLVNDHPGIAVEQGAQGAHVGQEDMSVAQARALLGRDRILGVSCHDSRHLAMEAGEGGADYVSFGAFFPTPTKMPPAFASPEILSWWQEIAILPCVAVGGIRPENAGSLVEAGADFLAVCSGVWDAPGGAVAGLQAFKTLLAS